MDRLLSLRNSESCSVLNNTSISSELGYETAQDDSISSLYYSINDDTLTEIDEASPAPITAPDRVSSIQTDQHTESITQSVGVESDTQTIVTESIESVDQDHLYQPAVSSSSDDVVENSVETVPVACAMNQVKPIGFDATAQNLLFNYPAGPPLSSNNITTFAGSSSIMEELYVVTVAQQQTNRAPELNRVVRRTTVRFQDSEMPRRNEMPRRSEMPPRIEMARRSAMVRRSEMPRKSEVPRPNIVPLSRRTQEDAQAKPRRTLMELNKEAKPEPGRKDGHVCDICKKSFPLRSTLIVHKASHKTECKYCDRTFKKAIALSIHLKENCQKIPLAVRRKILTKEFKNGSSMV